MTEPMTDAEMARIKAALEDSQSSSPQTYHGRVFQTDRDHAAWFAGLVARCERAEAARDAAMTNDKCDRCLGCGQIANSDDGEPWIVWLNLPPDVVLDRTA